MLHISQNIFLDYLSFCYVPYTNRHISTNRSYTLNYTVPSLR